MKPIVFLGLSLAAAEARLILDADYRGPVVRGDLDAITPPARVVIIDGILDADRRIAAEEVVRALGRGLVIHGVSSIGAVLAIELEHKGLRGSGRVFEALRALDVDLENLIMALYTAEQFKPLTTPLVNAVVYCWEHGADSDRLAAVVRELSGIPLDARSWERIQDAATNGGMRLSTAVRLMNVKRDDAINLLHALGKCPSQLEFNQT